MSLVNMILATAGLIGILTGHVVEGILFLILGVLLDIEHNTRKFKLRDNGT